MRVGVVFLHALFNTIHVYTCLCVTACVSLSACVFFLLLSPPISLLVSFFKCQGEPQSVCVCVWMFAARVDGPPPFCPPGGTIYAHNSDGGGLTHYFAAL